MSNMQIINLADNINAAFDKVNENFESLDSAVSNLSILDSADVIDIFNEVDIDIDSADITSIVNTILTEDYFLSVINEEYLQQFTINTSVDLTDVEAGIAANASAILLVESSISQTDSGITVLAQQIQETQAQLEGVVVGGIDEDLLAAAITSANSTVVSTSTRNFPNRLGDGANVFLASAELSAIAAVLGKLPTVDEYQQYMNDINPLSDQIYRYLNFNEIDTYVESANSAEIPAINIVNPG